MKFDWENKEEDRECVAIMWLTHLVIKGDDGEAFVLCSPNAGNSRAFISDLSFSHYENYDSSLYEKHKFYRGDSITITF